MKKISVIEVDEEEEEKEDEEKIEDELEDLLDGVKEFSEDITRSTGRAIRAAPALENVEVFSEPREIERGREREETKEVYSEKTIYEEGEKRAGRQGRKIFSETRNLDAGGMFTMILDNIRQTEMLENPDLRSDEEYILVEKRDERGKMPWELEKGEKRVRMRDYK